MFAGNCNGIVERISVRGLNQDHNKELKNLFKSAAISASRRPGPLRDFYAARATDPDGSVRGTKDAKILELVPDKKLVLEWIAFEGEERAGYGGPPVMVVDGGITAGRINPRQFA